MGSNRSEARFGALQYDLMKERASVLGNNGRQVVEALSALRAAPTQSAADAAAREKLVWAAAKCVWRYFVQREACGMRDHDGVTQEYAIPNEVLARVGAREPT
jgi:hypothetical protein